MQTYIFEENVLAFEASTEQLMLASHLCKLSVYVTVKLLMRKRKLSKPLAEASIISPLKLNKQFNIKCLLYVFLQFNKKVWISFEKSHGEIFPATWCQQYLHDTTGMKVAAEIFSDLVGQDNLVLISPMMKFNSRVWRYIKVSKMTLWELI